MYFYGDKFEDTQDDDILYIQVVQIFDSKVVVVIKTETESTEQEWNKFKFDHHVKTKRFLKIEGLLDDV